MTNDLTIDPDLDLVLTRDLMAPPAALWRCWTDAAHLQHWFVPKPHRVTECRLDARVGGAFNTTFDVGGTIIRNTGVYLELIPQKKLVFTDSYSEGWKPAPDPFMTAIVTFQDLGAGRTCYTAVVRHRTVDIAQRHRDMWFFDGWGTATDQLEAYAATLI